MWEHLFQTLASRLENDEISMNTAATIIEITARLASKAEDQVWKLAFPHRIAIVYQFCNCLPETEGWLSTVFAVGFLTEVHIGTAAGVAQEATWVYKALNSVHVPMGDQDQWDTRTVAGISGLLYALHHYGAPPAIQHMDVLLHALLLPGNISKNAAYLLLQPNIQHWYLNSNLWPRLQEASVWSSLTHFAASDYYCCTNFIDLGGTLASIPDWHPHIREELSSWITAFFLKDNWDLAKTYNYVLSTICNLEVGGYEFIEEAFGLSSVVLSKTWKDFDFTTSSNLSKSVSWLRCTTRVVLYADYNFYQNWVRVSKKHTPQFKASFFVPLRDSLIHAAMTAQQVRENASSGLEDIPQQNMTIFKTVAKILEEIASKVPQPTDPEKDETYWEELDHRFRRDIDVLEKSIQAIYPSNHTR